MYTFWASGLYNRSPESNKVEEYATQQSSLGLVQARAIVTTTKTKEAASPYPPTAALEH